MGAFSGADDRAVNARANLGNAHAKDGSPARCPARGAALASSHTDRKDAMRRHSTDRSMMSRPGLSKRALLAILAALAIALTAGVVASAKQSGDHSSGFANQLASARQATSKYATDLDAAKADGYQIITRDIPNMGWHFMNPKIQDFDVRRPPILVYEKTGPTTWQLAALEWVFPKKPAKSPFPSARYGSFPAACHYADGTFVPQASEDRCAKTAPDTGAAFTFWHPDLVTLHVWLWYPNPDGIFASYNPLVRPFNGG